jgi:ATP-dependent helicase/nuclease subunit A
MKPDLLAVDQRARERALDVECSFIVQAPAGSGKTELLTWRFLALLAAVEEPESVLAITFTRKAAAEMRSRIVGALRRVVQADEGGQPMHARTRELAQVALHTDHRFGWNLLANPGRLRIQTIDSLNLGLARRLPVLSGLGAGLGVEEDARELYREAAEQLLEHLPGGEARHAHAVATILAQVDNRVPRFIDLVVEMLARRDAWGAVLPAVTDDEAANARLRDELAAARRALVTVQLRAVQQAFPVERLMQAAAIAREASANIEATGTESPLSVWLDHESVPAADPNDLALWQGLAGLLLTADGAPRRRFDVRLGMPRGQAGASLKQRIGEVTTVLSDRPDLAQRLHAVRTLPEPGYSAREWEVLSCQLVVLRLAAAELELVFARRRVADYPRFAAAAQQALGTEEAPTDTALALDASLRHVLVDEFQDTSETQVRLLESLTAGWQRGDGRTLFLVGDPMQSIYRFRNAEVGLFLTARAQGVGTVELEPLTLAVNFRSTRPVVDWVNASFAQVLPAEDDAVRGVVSYAPSTCPAAADEGGGVCVHALFRRSRAFEAASVADIVQRRLEEDESATIAILVQARSHLVDIVGELARRGVPFQATDIDPLGERPVVLDLLALTRAMAHPADRSAWLTVLRAPWCGLTLGELHALCGDDLAATIPELLSEESRWPRLGVDARARLRRTWDVLSGAARERRRIGLRDAVARAWRALGGPATTDAWRSIEEAQAYLDQLAELERRSNGTIDLSQLEQALARLYGPSRPHKDIRVELLTIHKAKGLQFDTVIVPGLERRPGIDRKRLLQWTRIPGVGAHELVAAPLSGTGDEPNRLYRWLEGIEAAKLEQERRRLLYVAATRAKRWLHLFGSCRLRDEPEGTRMLRPATDVALGMLWPAVEHDFDRRHSELGFIEGETPPVIARDPPLRRLPLGWRRPTVAAPSIRSPVAPSLGAREILEFDWASETARHVGTVVHRELQRLADEGATAGDRPGDARARQRYRDELAELGVPAEHRDAAVERVVMAVRRTLEDARGRWLLDPNHRGAARELALSGRVDGEIVHVVIDRTFVDADGTRWVVDYKTSSHEGADVEAFLDREQRRYRSQLDRYASLVRHLGPEPVRLGLYFPLLTAWRESAG